MFLSRPRSVGVLAEGGGVCVSDLFICQGMTIRIMKFCLLQKEKEGEIEQQNETRGL